MFKFFESTPTESNKSIYLVSFVDTPINIFHPILNYQYNLNLSDGVLFETPDGKRFVEPVRRVRHLLMVDLSNRRVVEAESDIRPIPKYPEFLKDIQVVPISKREKHKLVLVVAIPGGSNLPPTRLVELEGFALNNFHDFCRSLQFCPTKRIDNYEPWKENNFQTITLVPTTQQTKKLVEVLESEDINFIRREFGMQIDRCTSQEVVVFGPITVQELNQIYNQRDLV